MSVSILSNASFGNVKETMMSDSILGCRLNLNLEYIFELPGHNRTPKWFHTYEEAVDLFVKRCVLFNKEAYRLRYNKSENPEQVTQRELCRILSKGKVVSPAQLFFSIRCIDYNADVTDYLAEDEFAGYAYRDEFNEWHKQVQKLSDQLAYLIAFRKAEEEKCNWF